MARWIIPLRAGETDLLEHLLAKVANLSTDAAAVALSMMQRDSSDLPTEWIVPIRKALSAQAKRKASFFSTRREAARFCATARNIGRQSGELDELRETWGGEGL